jgi:hypothetical protein
MGKDDISTLPFDEISYLCEKYSRRKARNEKRTTSSKATKSATASVTRAEIGNLLEEFKIDLLSTLGTQIDTLKEKKRQEEKDRLMAVFCPECWMKHALRECPLKFFQNVQVCAFFTENHDISHCSKIKILQNYNLEANAEMENLYLMGARRPWKTRPPGMFQNPNLQFSAHDSSNVPMPWQNWSNKQHQSYPQQWKPYQQYPQPYQQHPQPYQQYPQPYQQYPQTYQQYPQQQVVHQPQHTQQTLSAPPPINPPQLQLSSNQSPRPTQIPAQPLANPNNRADRPTYSVYEGTSYPILPLQNIELRSGKILQKETPAVSEKKENKENEDKTLNQNKQADEIQNKQMQTMHPPPFPDRLTQAKLPMPLPQFDVLDELKNVYIKIPLLQAIKDIPIYTKVVKELFLKKPTKKIFNSQTIHFIGNLVGLMANTISMEKYVDPGIPRVTTIINNIPIPNTLIDLRAAINVMTIETMKTLQLTNFQFTPIVLELADRSKIIPEGILEDIIV